MTDDRTGGPAYPVPMDNWDHGMTLRDYFAGQALVAVNKWHLADRGGRTVSQICYEIADGMIAARVTAKP